MLPFNNAVILNTDVVLNTSVSNSSITFSFTVRADNVTVYPNSIYLDNVIYDKDGKTYECDYINYTIVNANLDSANFPCSISPGGSYPETPGGTSILTLSYFDNFTLTFNNVWYTNTTETLKIETFDKNGSLIDVVNIVANYDSEYIKDKNVTRYHVGVYEKEFNVKNKTGKTNITFTIDSIQKEIEIEIRTDGTLDKIKDIGSIVSLFIFIIFLFLILIIIILFVKECFKTK